VITEKYAKIYNEDLAAIGCLPPTEQPKCTAHIEGMTVMISDLIEKGFAYESDGHVFFDVRITDSSRAIALRTYAAGTVWVRAKLRVNAIRLTSFYGNLN